MYAIIDFFTSIFNGIVNLLNTRFFDDVPITFLEVFLCGILLRCIIKFVFGGLKEVDTGANFSTKYLLHGSISNYQRKLQIVKQTGVKIHTSHGDYVLDRGTGRLYKQ